MVDNVGGYIRSPEPGCSFRPTGNFVGPYRFQNLEVDASVVMTNKSLTGPNRGYACGHLYFETERHDGSAGGEGSGSIRSRSGEGI